MLTLAQAGALDGAVSAAFEALRGARSQLASLLRKTPFGVPIRRARLVEHQCPEKEPSPRASPELNSCDIAMAPLASK